MSRGNISFNTIILAVVSVIVLLVMITIFTNKSTLISQDLSSCESKGGNCQGVCDNSFQTRSNFDCESSLTCCISVYDKPVTTTDYGTYDLDDLI